MMVLMRMINDHDKEGKIELVSGPSYRPTTYYCTNHRTHPGGDRQLGGRRYVGLHRCWSTWTSTFLDKVRECRSGTSYELAIDCCSLSFCDWDAGLNGMRWTIQKSLPRQGKKLKVAGDTLTLLRVTPKDAGVYVCTANNQQSRLISKSSHLYNDQM